MMPTPQDAAVFAPTGRLRASINLGNPILANKTTDGVVFGVSVDLAHALGGQLGVRVDLVVVTTAKASVEAVGDGRADVGFFAIDPLRGADIAFTAPYVLIEGAYMVQQNSPIRENAEVDTAGTRIVVGQGSAYDLYLSREIKQARLVRAPSSPAVIDVFLAQQLDVAAGVKQQLEADAKRHSGLRLLPGRFMVIQQAMGLPKQRGEHAASVLRTYVETQKANGFVAQALSRHKIEGASVAPAAI